MKKHFLISATLYFLTILCACSHSKDENLRSVFIAKKTTLIKVVLMLNEDSTMEKITPTYLRPTYHHDTKRGIALEDQKISAKRWQEYKKAFAEIGCTGGVTIDREHDIINFYFSTIGTSFDNTNKGLAYIPIHPIPTEYRVRVDLDHPPTKEGYYVVPLEGDWYLYYEY